MTDEVTGAVEQPDAVTLEVGGVTLMYFAKYYKDAKGQVIWEVMRHPYDFATGGEDRNQLYTACHVTTAYDATDEQLVDAWTAATAEPPVDGVPR
jgi:hypothetical protein